MGYNSHPKRTNTCPVATVLTVFARNTAWNIG